MVDIAQGLKYLHERDPPLLHRDLRSPNVFIQSLNYKEPVVAKVCCYNYFLVSFAQIADFGMSQQLLPNVGGLLLTWPWVAPEGFSDFSSHLYLDSP